MDCLCNNWTLKFPTLGVVARGRQEIFHLTDGVLRTVLMAVVEDIVSGCDIVLVMEFGDVFFMVYCKTVQNP